MNSEIKNCQNCKSEFKIDAQDFEFYEKMKVPAPTWCPDCRVRRRMGFYNVHTLYKRKCDKCGKQTISIYDQDTEFPVYCSECWWADDWDAETYAQEYDWNKTFLEQFRELLTKVPKPAVEVDYLKMVNSPYVNACGALKNCHLVFLGESSEDSAYLYAVNDVKDSMDCTNVSKIGSSYELFNCARIYNSSFLINCSDCLDVHFSKNLKNCNSCFGCVNLRNKSYCFFNEQLSKDDYKKKVQEIDLGDHQIVLAMQEKIKELFLQAPVKYYNGYKNENVSGDYIWNSKNVKNSYGIDQGENIKYSQLLEMGPLKDCYDYTNWGDNAQRMYEVGHAGENVANIRFTNGAWYSYNIEYSDNALHSHDLFGCVFMRKKEYCILNKKYTKEEYFEMVSKIKEQMDEKSYQDKQGRLYKYGEFFPPEFSPFAYNETMAQDYFPLDKNQAINFGFSWKKREVKNYQPDIKPEDLSGNISEADNTILTKVIGCATIDGQEKDVNNCTGAFKIIPSELEFYRKHRMSLPRYCPNCRQVHRLKNRNPMKLYKRTCMREGCDVEFETTYAPDRSEVVYCEKCYRREME